MDKIFKGIILLLALMISLTGMAQDRPEMADLMRSNGKIYVVVAVCLLILLGLFFYVWTLDRKITKHEKNQG